MKRNRYRKSKEGKMKDIMIFIRKINEAEERGVIMREIKDRFKYGSPSHLFTIVKELIRRDFLVKIKDELYCYDVYSKIKRKESEKNGGHT